jgi:anti-sigma B factor antagonist
MSRIAEKHDSIIITPDKDVVASMAEEFSTELHALIQKMPEEITIDLTNVKIVDSIGIGVLIAAHNSLSRFEGKLIVVNAAPNIYRLFTTMRLDRHFAVESAD